MEAPGDGLLKYEQTEDYEQPCINLAVYCSSLQKQNTFLRKLARLHEILHFSALFYTLSRFRGSCLKRGRDIPFHVLSTEDFPSIHVRHTN